MSHPYRNPNTGWTDRKKVSDRLQQIDPTLLGCVLKEMVQEAEHGSWDSIPARDVTGYYRLLADLALHVDMHEGN